MARILIGWLKKDVVAGEPVVVDETLCNAGDDMTAGTMCVLDTHNEAIYPAPWYNEWLKDEAA